MITHKIRNVTDTTCKECPQLWVNTCRAFTMSHSKQEYIKRLKLNKDGSYTNCYQNEPHIGEKYIEHNETEIKVKTT